MKYHDTHAHLDLLLQKQGYLPPYREFDVSRESDAVLSAEAREYLINCLSNHSFVVQPTISTKNLELVTRIFAGLDKVYFLIGSHPEMVSDNFDIDDYVSYQRGVVEGLSNTPIWNRIRGVGECGLDYFHGASPQSQSIQRDLFRTQIELALRLKLPLIIHTRDAWEDTFRILDEYPDIHGNILFHCFTGGVDEMKQAQARGARIALGGITTFNSAKDLQEATSQAPESMLMLETDLPFLTPAPHRGETCLPEHIAYTADFISELRQQSTDAIWNLAEANARSFFILK